MLIEHMLWSLFLVTNIQWEKPQAMHDYQLKWIGIWANWEMIIYRLNNNCQCCSFVAKRVLSDQLNQAFSVHLCEFSHSNSP